MKRVTVLVVELLHALKESRDFFLLQDFETLPPVLQRAKTATFV
jgi:hypothetical protein